MNSNSPLPRRAALVAGVATLFVLAYAGPASADIPVGWSDPPPVSALHDILLFIGIPLVATAVIFGFIYLPPILRGESVAPAGARPDNQWFGGRGADAELATSGTTQEPAELESARDTGGASGTW